ncbi:hypothetical protein BpHYR1_047692 [Brachionus plicatilis]|uniref:Uncharacterized protein n=1 Tax=Brachionus plicatilis TaxID=10195 RepID=A0A3M7T2X4_BRAPC|nr:hypothetical protein BpHYR1_047692 [Brachionus plicatilis]
MLKYNQISQKSSFFGYFLICVPLIFSKNPFVKEMLYLAQILIKYAFLIFNISSLKDKTYLSTVLLLLYC